MKKDEPRGWRASQKPPLKLKPADKKKHLERRISELEDIVERQAKDILELTMTAQDLATAITALRTTVENFPPPAPQLISQPELDAAVQGVQDANTALQAKIPPTP